MTTYTKLIAESTCVANDKVLDELENIMRHDIFHSTLDWQTKEQLAQAAKDALKIYNELDELGFYNN